MADRTRKIKKGEDDFEVVDEQDFDPENDELLVGPDEIVVKPKGVDGAKPFVIGEKDFDPRAYERVNLTKKTAAEIAKQQERETLTEQVEARKEKK